VKSKFYAEEPTKMSMNLKAASSGNRLNKLTLVRIWCIFGIPSTKLYSIVQGDVIKFGVMK
jgi:hypothetical protein